MTWINLYYFYILRESKLFYCLWIFNVARMKNFFPDALNVNRGTAIGIFIQGYKNNFVTNINQILFHEIKNVQCSFNIEYENSGISDSRLSQRQCHFWKKNLEDFWNCIFVRNISMWRNMNMILWFEIFSNYANLNGKQSALFYQGIVICICGLVSWKNWTLNQIIP